MSAAASLRHRVEQSDDYGRCRASAFSELYAVMMIGRKFDFSLKVVVVGESGVGKTCFLIRFVRDVFDDDTQSTLGIEFLSRIIQTENRRIQLQLWDTAGQEMFRSVTRGYYRGSAGALVLFDISNRDSFENVERWLQDVKSVARADVVLILIGNKVDLEASRQVRSEEALDFAQRHGMRYFEVSAKTGVGVAEAINGCVSLIERNLDAGSGPQPQQREAPAPAEDARQGSCC
jgi:small GTP-binding protein